MYQLKALRTAGALVAAIVLLTGLAAPALAQFDKNAAYTEMLSLAQQLRALKPHLNEGGNAVEYAQAEARYRALSQQLGGDDPGDLGINGGAGEAPMGVNGTAPPDPPGTVSTINTYSNVTSIAIPDNGMATSTVNVAGAGPYLWDANLVVFITHTFASDLDITLTSPAGTVVTLTTDNGGANDNVFNGTTWNDGANPGGQVPYTANNGVTTDHTYANLVVASQLVAEEAMGAFVGENPNGTWTLRVSDDTSLDTGTLVQWNIEIRHLNVAPAAAPVVIFANTTPTPLVDNGVITSTITVSGAPTFLLDVNAVTAITHTFSSDLDVTLMSPAGTIVTLTTDNGTSLDNVFNGTTWDDDANPGGQVPYTANNGLVTDHTYVNLTTATPLVPEEAMAAFLGENPNGTWTLTISDDATADTGTLTLWSLAFTGVGLPCAITCPANISTGTTGGLCSAPVAYPAPTTTGTCGVTTCTPASGSTFNRGTTGVTCTNTGGIGTVSCSFNITVVDDDAPVLTCPANVQLYATPTEGGATGAFPLPTVVENCPGVGAASCVPPSGTFFPIGTKAIVCSATDAAGNIGTCGFNVIVTSRSVLEIPTVGGMGLAALALLLAGGALTMLRRRRA